jgi:carboxyl-terminal processing protease
MAPKKERLLLIVLLVAVSLFFLLERRFLPGVTSKLSPYKSFELLGNVIGLVKRDYLAEVDPERTMKGALKGMIDSLDLLSSYLDKENALKYLELKNTRLKDTGIILSKGYGSFPMVIGVVENSPAEEKGIQIGDTISTLDGKSTMIMSLVEANLYLKNKEAKPVKLEVLRGMKTEEVSIERKLLFEKASAISQVEGTSGILKIHHLYPPCVNSIRREVLPALKSSKKPLILDLRNCHEGEIDEGLELINLFLKADNIGYFEKNRGAKATVSSPKDASLQRLPLAIWINQATIGAAEIVASVLRDMRQAKIIGVPTLGLAAKQKLFPLEDGSALLLTTSVFRLKSGKKLWEKGVEPAVKIDMKDQSYSSYLKKTFDVLSHM